MKTSIHEIQANSLIKELVKRANTINGTHYTFADVEEVHFGITLNHIKMVDNKLIYFNINFTVTQ